MADDTTDKMNLWARPGVPGTSAGGAAAVAADGAAADARAPPAEAFLLSAFESEGLFMSVAYARKEKEWL